MISAGNNQPDPLREKKEENNFHLISLRRKNAPRREYRGVCGVEPLSPIFLMLIYSTSRMELHGGMWSVFLLRFTPQILQTYVECRRHDYKELTSITPRDPRFPKPLHCGPTF